MKELDSIRKGIEHLEETGARFLKILYEQNVKLHYENKELKAKVEELILEIRKFRGKSEQGS